MEDTYNNRRNTTVNGESRIQYIPQEDVRYPARLRVLPGMPKGIYVLGRLPDDNRPSVAIVGARSSSAYGDGPPDSSRENWRRQACRLSAEWRGE